MYIVCKKRLIDGSFAVGTPPTVHLAFPVAIAEAERLAKLQGDTGEYVVFRAVAVARRVSAPVETVSLP